MSDAPKSQAAQREEQILAFWKERDIFNKTLAKESPRGEYVFYDGPPFATGTPHYGHISVSIIKDAVPRYRTMRGYHVPRAWGWDCHGLPIENIVEKELGFKHKKDIVAMGVAKFNELCRSKVLMYADEWKKVIPRIGRWVDMEQPYFTMSRDFMESVWWAFKELHDKGLVYEDYRSMHICPRCETTLSQSEVAEGYKDVKDIAVTVKFESLDEPDTYYLAWTTTPWTLPGNVALAVGDDIEYLKVKKGEDLYVIGKEALSKYPALEDAEVLENMRGRDLVGKRYKPLFDYFSKDERLKNRENGWKIYAADFITTDAGTGIAHEAPAFGAEDWELAKQVHLPFVQHVKMDGTFLDFLHPFAGMEVRPNSEDNSVRLAADIAILKYLQDRDKVLAKENIVHAYPHCWRCDTPLLNYATSSWFVSIAKLKNDLLDNARPINWSPAHIKEGRWGKWLENARDWSISRQRFWASVIPVWRCEQCKKDTVFGSVQQLEEASGQKIDDIHKHIVDEVIVPCECGGSMRRVPDVLDTWFDSGSMPYGQVHYPFEHKEAFEKTFPAQFIVEAQDQTRAWFYYLHVLSSALFNKNAFENVIVNGIVLAEDGKKMSKRLKNYPDPMEVVEKYGADALRTYFLSSPVMQAENLSFSEKAVEDIAKKNFGRLGNVLAFYQLYADGTAASRDSSHVLDRWIIARLDQLVRESTNSFEAYELDSATRPIGEFIDDLSVWYLRRSRDRFKEEGADKKSALATMRYVLHTLARIMAPSAPFFAEHLYQAVKQDEDAESVHLTAWPEVVEGGFLAKLFKGSHDDLLASMVAARRIVTQALEAREKAGIKVRQPLAALHIPADSKLADELLAIIADEVNVKRVVARGTTLELDVSLTPELREEGYVRDTIRAIQAFRKESGLKPGERTVYTATVSAEERTILEKHLEEIQKATYTSVEFTS